MASRTLTIAEANALCDEIAGMPLALPWKGYGSAIFFELGRVAPAQGKQIHGRGEASIYVGWDWRVEQGARVLFGSSNFRPQILDGLNALQGASIARARIVGPVPELVIEFAHGVRLVSAAMCTDTSEWTVALPGNRWLSANAGALYLDFGNGGPVQGTDRDDMQHSENVVQRWIVPGADGARGNCRDCAHMVRLDGDFHFLDYGVCSAEGGPFDGRVVSAGSGCQLFVERATGALTTFT